MTTPATRTDRGPAFGAELGWSGWIVPLLLVVALLATGRFTTSGNTSAMV